MLKYEWKKRKMKRNKHMPMKGDSNSIYRSSNLSNVFPNYLGNPEKVRYKVIGGEMKGMESSMKLVALGATQRKG